MKKHGGVGKVSSTDKSTSRLPKSSVNSSTARKSPPKPQQAPGPRNA